MRKLMQFVLGITMLFLLCTLNVSAKAPPGNSSKKVFTVKCQLNDNCFVFQNVVSKAIVSNYEQFAFLERNHNRYSDYKNYTILRQSARSNRIMNGMKNIPGPVGWQNII